MRNVIRVSVILAAIVASVVAAYSVIVIGMDVFRAQDSMSGMGFAVGGTGLLLALVIALAAAMGLRYLRTHFR
jgi:hypothetical protein